MNTVEIPQELKDRFDAIIVQHPLREDTRDGRLEQIYEIMNGLHNEHANHLIEALIEEAEKRRELQCRLSTVEAERDTAREVVEFAGREIKGIRAALSAAEEQARKYAEFITTEMGVAFVEKYRAVCRSCRAKLTISLLNHFLPQDHDEGCMYLKAQSYLSQQKGESQ